MDLNLCIVFILICFNLFCWLFLLDLELWIMIFGSYLRILLLDVLCLGLEFGSRSLDLSVGSCFSKFCFWIAFGDLCFLNLDLSYCDTDTLKSDMAGVAVRDAK